jgi:hypothetical protein
VLVLVVDIDKRIIMEHIIFYVGLMMNTDNFSKCFYPWQKTV